MNKEEQANKFFKLVDILEKLRGEHGCPWDKKQTHQSLMKYLFEESNEYIVCLKYSDLIFGISHVDRGRTLKVLETKDTTTWQTRLLSYYSGEIEKNKM